MTAPARPQEETFQKDQVLTVAGGHFVHDTFSAFLSPLLPLLQDRLGTSYASTGGLAIFAQLPSLLNPFIGHLADRVSLRYFIILAPGVTATLLSSIGLVSDYAVLALLLFIAGISMAAFHAPAPAMIAEVSGDHVGRGMGLFMAAGELGRTLGPVLVAAAVGWFGLEGIWRLAFFGWLASGVLYLRLRQVQARPAIAEKLALSTIWPLARRYFPLLGLVVLTRMFLLTALTTYLPLYMSDVRQANLLLGGAALTILEAAGVAGALASGTLSDSFGRTRILVVLLGLSPLLLLLFLSAPDWLLTVLLVLLGLAAISPQPVLLALTQDQFPHHRALANGLYLALSFVLRAGAIWLVGSWADAYGLSAAFKISAFIGLLAAPAMLLLDRQLPRLNT